MKLVALFEGTYAKNAPPAESACSLSQLSLSRLKVPGKSVKKGFIFLWTRVMHYNMLTLSFLGFVALFKDVLKNYSFLLNCTS